MSSSRILSDVENYVLFITSTDNLLGISRQHSVNYNSMRIQFVFYYFIFFWRGGGREGAGQEMER